MQSLGAGKARAVAVISPAPPPPWERTNYTLPAAPRRGAAKPPKVFPTPRPVPPPRARLYFAPTLPPASWQELGVPSRAPPRGVGPYKGKLAGAPASGRLGTRAAASGLRSRTFLWTRRGACAGWGHLGTGMPRAPLPHTQTPSASVQGSSSGSNAH